MKKLRNLFEVTPIRSDFGKKKGRKMRATNGKFALVLQGWSRRTSGTQRFAGLLGLLLRSLTMGGDLLLESLLQAKSAP